MEPIPASNADQTSLSPRTADLLDWVREEKEAARNPRNPKELPDQLTEACTTAIEGALTEDSELRQLTEEFLLTRPIRPSYAFQILRRALTKPLIRGMPSNNFPQTHFKHEAWQESFQHIFRPENPAFWELAVDLGRNLQSNVAGRYKGSVAVVNMMSDRFYESVDELDVGCAQNLGAKRTAVTEWTPFEDVEVLYPDSDILNPAATLTMKSLMKAVVEYRHIVGIDIINAKDFGNKEWARACTFYLKELLDVRNVEAYDLLDISEPPNVHFYWGDFLHVDQADFAEQSPVTKFDVVVFSTILYQLTDSQRAKMIKNARNYLNPAGIIIIQDFASVDPADRTKLIFHKDYSKPGSLFRYKTIVLDTVDESGEFSEVFVWKNGRCEVMRPGRDIGKICLNGIVKSELFTKTRGNNS